MTTKSLDEDGGSEARSFGTTAGDGGRHIAEHRAERAGQDRKRDEIARRTIADATKPAGGRRSTCPAKSEGNTASRASTAG